MTETYYNTLDIDTNDKEYIKNIIQKITSQKCCYDINVKPSSNKGIHIKMICSKKCDKCRLVFDDQQRLEHDINREEKFRNILFDNKEPFNGNGKFTKLKHGQKPVFINTKIKSYCEPCEKHNNKINFLISRDLSFDEFKIKLRVGKIDLPFSFLPEKQKIQAMYLGYTYLECPICKWFKIVKNTSILRIVTE